MSAAVAGRAWTAARWPFAAPARARNRIASEKGPGGSRAWWVWWIGHSCPALPRCAMLSRFDRGSRENAAGSLVPGGRSRGAGCSRAPNGRNRKTGCSGATGNGKMENADAQGSHDRQRGPEPQHHRLPTFRPGGRNPGSSPRAPEPDQGLQQHRAVHVSGAGGTRSRSSAAGAPSTATTASRSRGASGTARWSTRTRSWRWPLS